MSVLIRDHPFILKGGGLWFFWRKKHSVSKFDGKHISVSDMDIKKYSEALYALQNFVFVDKIIMSPQLVPKKLSAAPRSENKHFDSEKKPKPHPPPPPPPAFQLNGCSLNDV